jgi:hypothetical protein
VALALIGNPEPTTGFDPSARRAAWDMVSGLRQLGVSHHWLPARRGDLVAMVMAGGLKLPTRSAMQADGPRDGQHGDDDETTSCRPGHGNNSYQNDFANARADALDAGTTSWPHLSRRP